MVELGGMVSCWYVAGVALRRGKGFSRRVDAGNWGQKGGREVDMRKHRDGRIVVRGWATGEFFHVYGMVIGSVGEWVNDTRKKTSKGMSMNGTVHMFAATNGGHIAINNYRYERLGRMGVCVCLHPFVERACVIGTSGCILVLHMLSNYYSCGDYSGPYIHRHIASFERTYAEESSVLMADWICTLVLPCLSAASSYCQSFTLNSGGRKSFSTILRQAEAV